MKEKLTEKQETLLQYLYNDGYASYEEHDGRTITSMIKRGYVCEIEYANGNFIEFTDKGLDMFYIIN